MTDLTPNDTPQEHAAGLRRASDEFLQRLDRLYELESRKRELPPDQAEFIRLAREIEDLARGLLFSGGVQVDLAEEVHADIKTGATVVDQPIRETPTRSRRSERPGRVARGRAATRRGRGGDERRVGGPRGSRSASRRVPAHHHAERARELARGVRRGRRATASPDRLPA